MKDNIINIEGLKLKVEDTQRKKDEQQLKRLYAYYFTLIRKQTNMNRKEFAEWLGIPYRTMQDWELGKSQVPSYLLHLVAYKVHGEKEKGNI